MNKGELISKVSENAGITKKEAETIVSSILFIIEEALAAGDKVQLSGFGTFEVRERGARRGRNPQNGQIIEIAATRAPVFKPGKSIKKNMVRVARRKSGLPRIIAVTSGKGGVGKTNFVINTAIALSKLGLRVCIIDADLGTANVDVLLGTDIKYTLQHLVDRSKHNIMDIVADGPNGIKFIPGGSGLQSLADLPESELSRIVNMFKPLEDHADVILIDTGSGISRNVVNFVLAADEIIIVTTPEPHAITDAYAIIKVLNEKDPSLRVKLVVNLVENLKEAKDVAERMLKVVERFLEIKAETLGYILHDVNVTRAVKSFTPHIIFNPASPASICITTIAKKINPLATDLPVEEKPRGLLDKLKSLFSA